MITTAMSLAGRRVIVIGGSSGVGFAVAALARELGAEVVIASSNAANVAGASDISLTDEIGHITQAY